MMKENIVLTAGDGHVRPAYRAMPAAPACGQLVVQHEGSAQIALRRTLGFFWRHAGYRISIHHDSVSAVAAGLDPAIHLDRNFQK